MAYQFDTSGKLKELSADELATFDSDSAVFVLDQGTLENGTPYWAYIAVKPGRYAEFMERATRRQPIYLQEYGHILRYGLDSEVPVVVRKEMRALYNADDHYVDGLKEDVLKAQADLLRQQETERLKNILTLLKSQNT